MSNDATRQAFLQAVVENPFDLTPRLIYADWLEEQGQGEDAAFIRMPHLCPFPKPKRARRIYDALRLSLSGVVPVSYDWWINHERLLESETLAGYYGDMIGIGPRSLAILEVRHGYIEQIGLPRKTFWRIGPALVRKHPIHHVFLFDLHPIRQLPAMYGHWEYEFAAAWQLIPQRGCPPQGRNGSVSRIIYDLLGGSEASPRHDLIGRSRWHKTYSSADEAREFLSRACVNWARQEAGLPLLTFPEKSLILS